VGGQNDITNPLPVAASISAENDIHQLKHQYNNIFYRKNQGENRAIPKKGHF
jgi:hypothetical protein